MEKIDNIKQEIVITCNLTTYDNSCSHFGVDLVCIFFLMGSYSLYSLIMDFFMEYRGKHLFFFFLIYLFIFMAVLGLRFCARAFSSCGKRGPLFIAVRGPLTIAASLVAEHRLQTRRLSTCGSRT